MAAELLAALPDAERAAVSDALEKETADMEGALQRGDAKAWAEADDSFHRILVARCGNNRLRRIAQTVTDQAHRARVLTLKLRAKPLGSAAAHRRIVEAIRKGDCDDAHLRAREHRIAARDELVPLIVEIGLHHL